MKTSNTWKGNHRFEGKHEQNTIHLDGNVVDGYSPKALLLSGLASCSGIDVVDILEKMRVPFSDLVVDAEADQTEVHPRVFKDITLTYSIKTDKQNEDKVRKAIDLSLEKYCGVSAMLRKNSPIHYELVIG